MQPQQSKVAYRRIREHSTIYDLKGAYYFGICVSKLLLTIMHGVNNLKIFSMHIESDGTILRILLWAA